MTGMTKDESDDYRSLGMTRDDWDDKGRLEITGMTNDD